MTEAHDEFKRMETPEEHMEPCPCCGADAELWQRSTSPTSPCTKFGACTTSYAIGPQDGLCSDGCLLYMPPDSFYKATIREAVKYWNEFAKALAAAQRANRWERAQVLRIATSSAEEEKS